MAAAWDEVYWLMAFALVNQERGLYSARGVRPETVWRPWRVTEKIPETADVTTFVVERVDDRLVNPPARAVVTRATPRCPTVSGSPRQYSLTRADYDHHRHSPSSGSAATGTRRRDLHRSCATRSTSARRPTCAVTVARCSKPRPFLRSARER